MAKAQQLIHEVLMRCPLDAEKAVKKADLDVRRCRACCTNLQGVLREEFLKKATEAYDGLVATPWVIIYFREQAHSM